VLDTVRKQAEKIAAAEARVKELEQSREWQSIDDAPDNMRLCLSDGQYIVYGEMGSNLWRDDQGETLRPQPTHFQRLTTLPAPPVTTGTKEDRT
jgi:hypothetical protein